MTSEIIGWLWRSLIVALIVGTILVLLNHIVPVPKFVSVICCFIVPFFVSLHARCTVFFRNSRQQTWKMNLEANPLWRIKAGQKVFECRLNKPKWGALKIGDYIEFQCVSKPNNTCRVVITELLRFGSFRSLVVYIHSQGCIEVYRSVNDQVSRLEKRYPPAERNFYSGVLGIRFKLISDIP